MLQNDFYTAHDLQYGDQAITCRIVFNAAHDIFRGHFPQQPVVPGVCMMQIVKELLMQRTGRPLMLREAAQVKFLRLMLPDTQAEVAITWKEENDVLHTGTVFKAGETALFRMSAVFA